MLTKEECEKSLEWLKVLASRGDYETREHRTFFVREQVKVIEQLIEERFDNPPLKFEELKENEWYWDNKKKRYFKIFELDVPNKEIIAFDYWGLGFEEGRFYRKQVLDE